MLFGIKQKLVNTQLFNSSGVAVPSGIIMDVVVEICWQAVLLSLAKEVEFLSTSLKKAGWSIPDVSESMKWDSCTLW